MVGECKEGGYFKPSPLKALVGEEGIEPSPAEPQSAVLPLHHRPHNMGERGYAHAIPLSKIWRRTATPQCCAFSYPQLVFLLLANCPTLMFGIAAKFLRCLPTTGHYFLHRFRVVSASPPRVKECFGHKSARG